MADKVKTPEQLAKAAAYHREWRARNRDRTRALNSANQRKWRHANPDKNKANCHRWYQKNKERQRAKRREYYVANREAIREKERLWRRNNQFRAKMRDFKHGLKKDYGITLEQYEELFKRQDNRCGICRTKRGDIKRPCVDHCHSSLQVRGVLCQNCNVGLAHFRDNPLFLKYAIYYLQRTMTTTTPSVVSPLHRP